MKNITIADIAATANVSIGTVSNVLNKKGNVKIETIRKVEETAKLLGYVRNENAQVMKNKISNIILLIVPILNSTLEPLILDLLHDLKINEMDLKIIEIESYANKQELLNFLKQGQYKAAICLALIGQENVLQMIPKEKQITIGNTKQSTIKMNLDERLFNTIEIETYTIITDQDDFGIHAIIQKNIAQSLAVATLKNGAVPESFSQLKKRKFIVFSNEVLEKLIQFYRMIPGNEPEFILISCHTGYHLYDSLAVHKFYFSSNELALKIIKAIRTIDKTEIPSSLKKEKITIYATSALKLPKVAQPQTIRLLVLKNPFSKALKQLVFQFIQETAIRVEITELSFSKFNDMILKNKTKDFDMIKLDVSQFPWVGPNLFLNLNKIPSINTIAYKLKNWQEYCYVDDQLLALPADPSIQMMIYRKDIFDNPIIKKAYLDNYGEVLKIPTTYNKLADYCEFYQSMTIPEKKIPYPMSINKDNDILLASEFLPYFFSIGGEISYKTSFFEMNSDKFMETISAYKKIRTHSKIQTEPWWDKEIQNFNERETSLIICYTNHLNQIIGNDYSYAAVPGQTPAFGGGVLGITKNTKQLDACTLFFEWLYQYRTQEQLASLGVCVPSTHFFDERNNYRKYPFLSYSSKNFSIGKRLQYVDQGYALNTYEIEKIIGHEINLGLDTNASDFEILIKIHNQLNSNKYDLLRKI